MAPWMINVSVFLTVFLAVFAGNALLVDLYSRERKRLKERMEEQLRQQQRKRARKASAQAQDLGKLAAEARAEFGRQRKLSEKLEYLVDQSGLDVSVRRLVLISIALGLGPGLLIGLLTRNPLSALVVAAIAIPLPWLYVLLKRHQRLDRLREQLPDAFELMSRVLRAGQTITQAMQAVAEEFSRPISLEFLYCYEQMNLGLSPEQALRILGQRTGLLEIKIFILSVVVHRSTGGNLAELLDKLASVVRERFRIHGMIRSLTAQGRFQGAILLGLPLFMFVLLMLIDPEYEMVLLQYPMMIVVALSMMTLGALWIRRIVNFDF